jgi:Ankyrin repeats (3 copies)
MDTGDFQRAPSRSTYLNYKNTLLTRAITAIDGYKNSFTLVEEYTPKGPISTKNKKAVPLLHEAARTGNYELVTLLVQSGTNMHSKDQNGLTARDLACFNSDSQMVELLDFYIKKEYDLTLQPTNESLTEAIELGYYTVVHLLLTSGFPATQEHLNKAKEKNYKKIGRLLKHYLGFKNSNLGISHTGILKLCLMSEDIAHLIASFALNTI